MKKKMTGIIALLALTMILLCGCATSPTSAADAFMQGIQKQDLMKLATVYDIDAIEADNTMNDIIQNYIQGNDSIKEEGIALLEKFRPYIDKLFDFDYVISNEKTDGNTATVDVKITTYNYGEALKTAVSDMMNQSLSFLFSFDLSSMKQTLESAITAALDQAKKNSELTATLDLVKKNGKWIVADISENAAFINAMTGGLSDTVLSMPTEWFR